MSRDIKISSGACRGRPQRPPQPRSPRAKRRWKMEKERRRARQQSDLRTAEPSILLPEWMVVARQKIARALVRSSARAAGSKLHRSLTSFLSAVASDGASTQEKASSAGNGRVRVGLGGDPTDHPPDPRFFGCMGVVTVPPSTTRMPGPLKRLGPGSQNLSGMATRPGEVVVEEVDRGGMGARALG